MKGEKIIKGISICILLMIFSLTLLPTVCFFSTREKATTTVSAASTEDIIDYKVEKVNPKEIIIKRASNVVVNPTIYFGVKGYAKKYILHINPVNINSDGEYKIPINLNVNLSQYLQLYKGDSERNIPCELQIKYLNQFIDEKINIEFTKEYLMNVFLNALGTEEKDMLEKKLKKLSQQKNNDEQSGDGQKVPNEGVTDAQGEEPLKNNADNCII